MTKLRTIFIISALFLCQLANAEVKDLNVVISKATAAETKDLAKLMSQISMKLIQGASSKGFLYKVDRVEKGSLWDREGIKVGDTVRPN